MFIRRLADPTDPMIATSSPRAIVKRDAVERVHREVLVTW